MKRDETDWEARAVVAECELTELRTALHEYRELMRSARFGPIIFRSEVVEKLDEILA